MDPEARRSIFVCSCERSMPSYGAAVGRACPGARLEAGDQFCGADLERVRAALGGSDSVVIACTQQAPLFLELAEETGFAGDLAFVNIRENGGWSAEAGEAGPKAAALVAAAYEHTDPPAAVPLSSRGVILVYGGDATALTAAQRLAESLDVTVVLRPGTEATPLAVWEFPVYQGRIRNASGYLGAFALTVDSFAAPSPSSRDMLHFGAARDGAVSHCDIVLDLSDGPALFPAGHLRPGYLRVDPGDRAGIEAAIGKAAGLVGDFDKPRYVDFHAELCAHSRSKKTGCTRCLDLCPTGAIIPAGDHVAISAEICAGCGSCAAVCPTGAAAYALPAVEPLMRRLRRLLTTFSDAGGKDAVILFHDGEHGAPLIDALARFGEGLPARVLPFAVNEVSQLGPEAWTAPLAWGASAVRAIGRARARVETEGIERNATLANLLAAALGYGEARCGLVETDDPDGLAAALAAIPAGTPSPSPSRFLPVGAKRSVLETTMIELHRAAPAPVAEVALPAGAPFGTLDIDVEGCTLCLSCVSACPTGALSDSAEKPALYFSENACVQCGLCAATCPEEVIALWPRLGFEAWSERRRTVKEEEPFHCIGCGTAFGTKSTVERIVAKLEGRHWMYSGANTARLDLVRMCDKCRVAAVTNQGFDPYGSSERDAPRTTEDYLRERDRGADPAG